MCVMSIGDSLFVGLFGMSVVFIVLVGLSLLLRAQSALITWFSPKKPVKPVVSEAADDELVAADASFDTPPSIFEPSWSEDAGSETVTSPVSGTVIEIMTAVGAKVKRGDLLLLLEAMRMENGVAATRDGTVTQILTSCGKTVVTGTPLIVIQ